MPDISMCDNDKCPKRKQWQSRTHFDLKTYDGECYLPVRDGAAPAGDTEKNDEVKGKNNG